MIVTAAMTMVRKAENSERIMLENLKRSLPNNSTESKGEDSFSDKNMSENLEKSLSSSSNELKSVYSHKARKWEIRWMKNIIQLLDSIQDSADNKAVIERLEFFENSDLICTCHS